MSDKFKKIYDALVDGAEDGLTGTSLYKHVVSECPKATSKKIVKASLLALTDPDMKDEKVLRVIYDLAITHRLDPSSDEDGEQEDTPEAPKAKVDRKSKKRGKAEKREDADGAPAA